MTKIEELVSYQEDVNVKELTSTKTQKDIIKARHLLWYLIFNCTEKSLNEIGDMYGRKPLQIRNGIRNIDDECVKSKEFREYVGRLKSQLL